MACDLIEPEFERAISVSEYLVAVPQTATIKGLFMSTLLDALGARRHHIPEGQQRYVAFKDYPLVEQVRLIPEVARVLYPGVRTREGLRRLGHRIYPAFAGSLLGRVLFAAVGHNPTVLLEAGCRAYQMSASVGKVEILDVGERQGLLKLCDIYNYLDSYHVGIFEGAFSVLGFALKVRVHLDTLSSGVFEIRW